MDKLTKEQQELVLNNHNLVYSCIKSYNLDLDEFYDVAVYGLCKAALNYDESNNTKFSTYAYVVMGNELKMELRRINNRKKCESDVSLNSLVETQSGNEYAELIDLIPDDYDFEAISNIKIDFIKMLSILNITELKILSLLINGYRCTEIGEKLNTSRAYIYRVIARINDKYTHMDRYKQKKNTDESEKIKKEIIEKIKNL